MSEFGATAPRPPQDDPARAGEQTRFVLDQWGQRTPLDAQGNRVQEQERQEPVVVKESEAPVTRRRRE